MVVLKKTFGRSCYDGISISPRVMASSVSITFSPSSRSPECWYLLVTQILQSGIILDVSSENSRST